MKRNEAFERWLNGAVFAVVLLLVLKYAPPPRDPLVGEPLGTFQLEPPMKLLSPTLHEQVYGLGAPYVRDTPMVVYPLGRTRVRTVADPPGNPCDEWLNGPWGGR